MRLIFYIFVLLAVIASGIYGFGTNLPARHKFTEQATYKADINLLWKKISNYQETPKQFPIITRAERLPDLDGKPVWRIYDRYGFFMDVQILQKKEPFFQVSKIINTDYPFTGTWIIELAKVNKGDSVVVRLTEEGHIESPIWRVVMRFVGLEYIAREYLKFLGKNIDSDDSSTAMAPEKPLDDQEEENINNNSNDKKKND